MGWPRKTVDAAMLAAAVRVDRTVKADIGRVVARNHLASGIDRDGGLERRQFVEALPAVVECEPRLSLETAAGVGLRAAAAPPLALDRDGEFGKRRRRTRRLGGRRDRRGVQGLRGCATHGPDITNHENKIKTTKKKIQQRKTAKRR